MKVKDINELIGRLYYLNVTLRDLYIEGEGEVTEETESLEEEKSIIKELLSSPETIDALGRMIVKIQTEADNYKAEEKKAASLRKERENAVDYFKSLIRNVLDITEQPEVKGTFYKFKVKDNETTIVNKELLRETYQQDVVKALESILPPWVTVELKALSSAVPEGTELPEIFTKVKDNTIGFTKPRKSKEVCQ